MQQYINDVWHNILNRSCTVLQCEQQAKISNLYMLIETSTLEVVESAPQSFAEVACYNILPNELKLLIWEAALHSLEPQTITMTSNNKIQTSRTSIPSIFHIDSCSRFVALRNHVLIGMELDSSNPSPWNCAMPREYKFSEIVEFKPRYHQSTQKDYFFRGIRDPKFAFMGIGDQFQTANDDDNNTQPTPKFYFSHINDVLRIQQSS